MKEYIVQAHTHKQIVIPIISDTDREVNVTVRLVGLGATAEIIGIVVGRGKGTISLHTLQHHEAPETTSNLLVKSVLYDEATFTYSGAILVDPKAQKTDAYQRNENLLLSPLVHVKSEPALEILANDVRCTHGATIGTPGKDQLWYLLTRGVSEKEAGQLIIKGFLQNTMEQIQNKKLRKELYEKLY